eukprot:jgi/Phyca11/503437/fgenesh2_kg.PHYCAscaffold_3_\
MAEPKHALILQALQTDEARRARQREHVKNSYYRKQNVMKALRQEVSDLELQYSRTLQLKQQQMEWREVAETLGGDSARDHSDDLVEQYMQLSIKKQQLVKENKELVRMGTTFSQFQLKTEHLLYAEPKVTLKPPPMTVDAITLEAMTVPECHQIASQALKEIEDFRENSKNNLTTGLEVFGWREQRREETDHVKFTLTKRFVGVTPFDMSARGWRVVSSPRGLAGLYSSTMYLSMKVLQVVDDYNVIMYRIITNASTLGTVQSLFLVSRFRTNTGYAILFRSVDRNRLRKVHPDGSIGAWDTQDRTKWLDMFTWTLFDNDVGNENAVIFSYGGIVYGTEAVNTRMWMLEILSLALRWENKVVGPTMMLNN